MQLTPEQLPLLNDNQPGVMVIRGAAGSGKTTTALMRLRQLCSTRLTRRARMGSDRPVRVLVLTFNRTLEGYVRALAEEQVAEDEHLELSVTTISKWAKSLVSEAFPLNPDAAAVVLRSLCAAFPGDTDFLCDEVNYLLGRFRDDDIDSYVGSRRDGRGASPRMDDATRVRLLDEVVRPYQSAKHANNMADWNDLAVAAATAATDEVWDVIVVDETQDFSANELRAVLAHIDEDTSVTFIIDAAQQIYKKGFTWKEIGVEPVVRPLKANYRNTQEIAAFARPLMAGLPLSADGALPDLSAATRSGSKPVVLEGRYNGQVRWALRNVVDNADLATESVAFLQFRQGAWSDTLKTALSGAGVEWVDLTRQSVWPGGDESVAVCTLHSAKGLEFDHVVILGINGQVTPHGTDEDDTDLDSLRRLLAMGVGRARKTVTIGYKPGEASKLISYLAAGTFRPVTV